MEYRQQQIDFDKELDSFQKDAHSPRFESIFSGPPITGDELKEEGMTKVMRKEVSRLYGAHLREALKIFPIRSLITADKLTAIVGRPPKGVSDNAVGAIIAGIAKQGMIEKTGRMVKSMRKETHSREVAEWRIVSFAPAKRG